VYPRKYSILSVSCTAASIGWMLFSFLTGNPFSVTLRTYTSIPEYGVCAAERCVGLTRWVFGRSFKGRAGVRMDSCMGDGFWGHLPSRGNSRAAKQNTVNVHPTIYTCISRLTKRNPSGSTSRNPVVSTTVTEVEEQLSTHSFATKEHGLPSRSKHQLKSSTYAGK
jgi:hypothetical protein